MCLKPALLPEDCPEKIYDYLCTGFGPAGIALSAAQEDAEEAQTPPQRLRSLFLEQAAEAAWQPEMLLPGTDIQHHFLRDFATPRNPRSRFTFANYLYTHGRLFRFGLHGGNPGRFEWAHYVRWVAQQLAHHVRYRHQVTAIEALHNERPVRPDVVRVRATDLATGVEQVFYTRNVVLSTGRTPNIPALFAPLLGDQIFHSSTFKTGIQRMASSGETPTFTVIGSGQNAIEIVLDLADRFPTSTIRVIHRNSGFRIYDLGHFSNEVYFPEAVDYVFGLPKAARQQLYKEIKYTNYASVDADVSQALYRRVYEEDVCGIHRIQMLKRSAVVKIIPHEGTFNLLVEDVYQHRTHLVQTDVVILCTGYVEHPIPPYLQPLRPYCHVDSDGDLVVTRDYAVCTDDRLQAGIFLNGLTERTHGISDAASFSMMAIKAQRIWERIEARVRQAAVPVAANGHPTLSNARPGGGKHCPVARAYP